MPRVKKVLEGKWTTLGGVAAILSLAVAVVTMNPPWASGPTEEVLSPPKSTTRSPATTSSSTTTTSPSTVTSQDSTTAAPPTTTISEPPAPQPAPQHPSVRWQGSLTAGEYAQQGLKDLDPNPPMAVPHDNRGDVWFRASKEEGAILYAVDGAEITSWGFSSPSPDYDHCRSVVGSGVHRLKVHPHEIVCARTSEARTALLIVTALSDPVVPGSTIKLDVIVWDPVA